MATKVPRLTTIDNPYNPFSQWDDWLRYDLAAGHDTCAVLARHCFTSDLCSDEENFIEIERAIDEIIERDPTQQFAKVYEDSAETENV